MRPLLQAQAASAVRQWRTAGCIATPPPLQRLMTLAIESSCDDTSVAVLEKRGAGAGRVCETADGDRPPEVTLHFHERITSNNLAHRGIHPIVALDSHQRNLALLVRRAIDAIPKRLDASKPVDFITVTRGPGMRSNLSVGLDTAKGLAVAWDVPLLGVNHMQAHALTPRLTCAMEHGRELEPRFPFLSLLVSGGHTMLLHSRSLCEHPVLAETGDIAIGDAIDKIARLVVPAEVLAEAKSTMYGPVLESFAFSEGPGGPDEYSYVAPATREQELERKMSRWGWGFLPPLSVSRGGHGSRSMAYSFSGTVSAVARAVEERDDVDVEERRAMAREAMRVMFEHLASRVVLGLQTMRTENEEDRDPIAALVVSGGVAANGYLRTILRDFLAARGHGRMQAVFPPASLCTDNAAMIGWTGMEMFQAGWRSTLSVQPLRRWSLDPDAGDGGVLGAEGWQRAT